MKNHSTKLRRQAINRLKKKAQLYARLRDCDGRTGGANCISCNVWKPFPEGDGGHFIAATQSAIMFDERNINFQCRRCNRYKGGNQRRYLYGMIRKYGQEVVDELEAMEFQTRKWTITELAEMEDYYNEKLSHFD